jgi:hypothetical protein
MAPIFGFFATPAAICCALTERAVATPDAEITVPYHLNCLGTAMGRQSRWLALQGILICAP